jgi:hypothetical protein
MAAEILLPLKSRISCNKRRYRTISGGMVKACRKDLRVRQN